MIDSDDLSVSRETHRVSSCDERTSYVPCLQLAADRVGSWAGRVTIDILPDDVLLHIFLIDGKIDSDVHDYHKPYVTVTAIGGLEAAKPPWWWYRLVHVCRRWRSIIFASPNFLELRLVCGPRTPMELIGIWPPLPIIMTNSFKFSSRTRDKERDYQRTPEDYDFDAATVHPNRVREICFFRLTISMLQRLGSATLMQEQFPALTRLILHQGRYAHPVPALPDRFLGGSAPLLQYLELDCVSFPALPKFLLSTTHLVRLILRYIPHTGYFSPEAIVTVLARMTNLESLDIDFESPLSRPHRESRRLPPPIRIVLPALTRLYFKGVSEYLEDFVARIDAPLLDSFCITFFHQLIFDIPRLAEFMGRTTRFQEFKRASLSFSNDACVSTSMQTPTYSGHSQLRILCRKLDWQLSSLAQVFTSFFPSIYTVDDLSIGKNEFFRWRNDIENMQWLEIFNPFTAVKNLHLSYEVAPYIAPALQELVGGRTMEVLPSLQNISLWVYDPSEPILEGVEKFVAARQLSNYPITVSRSQILPMVVSQ